MPAGKRIRLARQQLVEERAVAAQRDPQFLGGRLTLPPLAFELALVLGERGGQGADHGRDQLVGLVHRLLRVVDEAGLHILPAVPEAGDLLLVDQRRGLDVTARLRGPGVPVRLGAGVRVRTGAGGLSGRRSQVGGAQAVVAPIGAVLVGAALIGAVLVVVALPGGGFPEVGALRTGDSGAVRLVDALTSGEVVVVFGAVPGQVLGHGQRPPFHSVRGCADAWCSCCPVSRVSWTSRPSPSRASASPRSARSRSCPLRSCPLRRSWWSFRSSSAPSVSRSSKTVR